MPNFSSQCPKRQETKVRKTKFLQKAISEEKVVQSLKHDKSWTWPVLRQEKFIYVKFQVKIFKGNKIEIVQYCSKGQ